MSLEKSYTSASVFPEKMFYNQVIGDNNNIIPIHAQIIPTNKCNLKCSFCSCDDRNKNNELTLDQTKYITNTLYKNGTKAVTITGGGEPLMYKNINIFIEDLKEKDLEVGLVTNGILLDKLNKHINLTWGRISCSDDRKMPYETIYKAINKNKNTDWAFSYVVTDKPNYERMKEVIEFANYFDFTHIRLVSDLLNLNNIAPMSTIKEKLKGINLDKVIFQGRKDSTIGTKNCYISLLKPVISPEGIFPCCGFQYHKKNMRKDCPKELRMGDIKDLEKIIKEQKNFNGEVCDVCYYKQYNDALTKVKEKIKHVNFI